MSLNHSTTVIVPVFGDLTHWLPLADKAVKSVQQQTVKPTACYLSRGDNLAEARNNLILNEEIEETERLIFLDADDTLHPDYIAEIDKIEIADLIQTAISYDGGKAHMLPEKDLFHDNYLHIGTAISTELFKAVGGFDPSLEALEDYFMFAVMVLFAGATVTPCPTAVYEATSRPNSRNRGAASRKALQTVRERLRALQQIEEQEKAND